MLKYKFWIKCNSYFLLIYIDKFIIFVCFDWYQILFVKIYDEFNKQLVYDVFNKVKYVYAFFKKI